MAKQRARGILPDLDWANTYKSLGIPFDPASVIVSNNEDYWPIVVCPGVTCNGVVQAFRKMHVDVQTWVTDLDRALVKNRRSVTTIPYVVYVRRRVEADLEWKGYSADMLRGWNVSGVTLPERLLHGYAYFITAGKHLDLYNETLCSGSRDSENLVPFVKWRRDNREVYVGCDGPSYHSGNLRARQVFLPSFFGQSVVEPFELNTPELLDDLDHAR